MAFRPEPFWTTGLPRKRPISASNMIQDGYFAAVGTKLLRGRDLAAADILQGRSVAVITEDMVKRDFSAGKIRLGHHIVVDIFNEPIPPQMLKAAQFHNSFEIVGVVGSARNRGLEQPAYARHVHSLFGSVAAGRFHHRPHERRSELP